MRVSPRLSLDDWAFALIESYARRGTCIRRQAGALALDQYNLIIGLGMNGVPRGFQHCTTVPCIGATDPAGDTSNCYAIHAETNMILNSRAPMEIEKVYTSTTPCLRCALAMANLPNLKTVKSGSWYADRRGVDVLETSGVKVIVIERTAS